MNERYQFQAGILALALLVGMIAAVYWLYYLTLDTGTSYPHYSSFRKDPFGSKLLYSSLESTGKIKTHRNFTPFTQFDPPNNQPATFLFISIRENDIYYLSKKEEEKLNHLLDQGWHFVFALTPQRSQYYRKKNNNRSSYDTPKKSTEKSNEACPKCGKVHGDDSDDNLIVDQYYPSRKGGRVQRRDPDQLPKFVSLREKWDFHLSLLPPLDPDSGMTSHDPESEEEFKNGANPHHKTNDDDKTAMQSFINVNVINKSKENQTLPWFSHTVFQTQGKDWEILARRGDDDQNLPVAISKPISRGRVTLLTDSYIFSNESLSAGNGLDFLHGIISAHPHVYFDETIHNVVESKNVVGLIRDHKFEGVFYGLILVALLAAWRAIMPFPPFPKNETPSDYIQHAPHNSLDAMTSLLSRAIPPKSFWSACKEELSHGHGALGIEESHMLDSAVNQIQKGENPIVHPFNRIQSILKNKRKLL